MKKIIFIIMILSIFLCSFIQAQGATGKTPYYAKTVLIYKIYSHALGYKIVYHKVGLEQGVIYIPFSWFAISSRKAETIYGNDRSYPFFTSYYKDGKFEHITLYLQESHDHVTWGLLHLSLDEAQKLFDVNPDNYAIEY
jgi:hypothetical protein